MLRSWGWGAAGALVLSLSSATAAGAASAAHGSQQALEQRVRDLERQNADLLRRLERLEGSAGAPPTAAPSSTAAAPSAAAPPVVEPGHDHAGSRMLATLGDARGSFQVFGDAGFGYRSKPESGQGDNAFALGQLDLFATGQMGDHLHAVAEIAVEGDSADNETEFDVERLWGSWTFADALTLKLGREHSPLSRWNRRYHHGRWLWLSATQPFLARFEDDDGPLPVHAVGLEASGRIRLPVGMFEYAGVVSNGRGRTPEEVQSFGDHNGNKAGDVGFGFFPVRVRGLGVGAAVHVDEIPTVPGDPRRRHGIGELIPSAYLEHFGGRFETLGEFAWIGHRDRTSNRDFNNLAGYLQLGYHVGRLTPFTRFDWRNMGSGDPFYAPEDIDLDQWEQALGVRYDVTENFAVKLEGAGGREQERSDSGSLGHGAFGRLAAQFALVF